MSQPSFVRQKAPLKGFVTSQKAKHHAEILSNRVRNRFRHLSRRFRKAGIDCFRLYDWDIPEVRAVIDWYAGHIVVAEYERLQTTKEWLPLMADAVAKTLSLEAERVHLKRRRTQTKQGPRYQRLNKKNKRFSVKERDLSFWVNLEDYLDTGLFSDHRHTRLIIQKLSRGHDFLNLFAYTGTFTCAAALGGAKSTVTVDRSQTYIHWAKDNLSLNGLSGPQHTFVKSDTHRFLGRALRHKKRFTLAVIDPPSFFKDKKNQIAFDINRDHPRLIREVIKIMKPGSIVFFSTNHQRFEPKLDDLPVADLKELTPKTIPEDYRNRTIHRCWQMVTE